MSIQLDSREIEMIKEAFHLLDYDRIEKRFYEDHRIANMMESAEYKSDLQHDCDLSDEAESKAITDLRDKLIALHTD